MSDDTNTIPAAEVPPPEAPEETPAPTPLNHSDIELFLDSVPKMVPSLFISAQVDRAIEAIEDDSLTDKERAEVLAPLQSSILSAVEVFLQNLHMEFGGEIDSAPAVFRNMNFDSSGKAKESDFNTQVKSYFTIDDRGAVWPHQLVLPSDVKSALQLRSAGGSGFYENKMEQQARTLASADEVVLSNEPLIRR